MSEEMEMEEEVVIDLEEIRKKYEGHGPSHRHPRR